VRVSDIFGAQANGVFAVSDFVVRPSTNANNALKFHVGTGRILNLPVNDSGYLRASQISPAGLELPLNPAAGLELLSRQNGAASTPEVFRIDAEPHWEVNAQNILFWNSLRRYFGFKPHWNWPPELLSWRDRSRLQLSHMVLYCFSSNAPIFSSNGRDSVHGDFIPHANVAPVDVHLMSHTQAHLQQCENGA
jgi:hypothetical protein